jgi:ATP-dependent DNA helicase RecG
MAKNGSPLPIFETDEQHYVMVTIPVHTDFTLLPSIQASGEVKLPVFNTLEDWMKYANEENGGASNVVSNGVKSIIDSDFHNRVEEDT